MEERRSRPLECEDVFSAEDLLSLRRNLLGLGDRRVTKTRDTLRFSCEANSSETESALRAFMSTPKESRTGCEPRSRTGFVDPGIKLNGPLLLLLVAPVKPNVRCNKTSSDEQFQLLVLSCGALMTLVTVLRGDRGGVVGQHRRTGYRRVSCEVSGGGKFHLPV